MRFWLVFALIGVVTLASARRSFEHDILVGATNAVTLHADGARQIAV